MKRNAKGRTSHAFSANRGSHKFRFVQRAPQAPKPPELRSDPVLRKRAICPVCWADLPAVADWCPSCKRSLVGS
jgi:hypothetical protein